MVSGSKGELPQAQPGLFSLSEGDWESVRTVLWTFPWKASLPHQLTSPIPWVGWEARERPAQSPGCLPAQAADNSCALSVSCLCPEWIFQQDSEDSQKMPPLAFQLQILWDEMSHSINAKLVKSTACPAGEKHKQTWNSRTHVSSQACEMSGRLSTHVLVLIIKITCSCRKTI